MEVQHAQIVSQLTTAGTLELSGECPITDRMEFPVLITIDDCEDQAMTVLCSADLRR
jgi:hypothetical protein